MAHKVHSIKYNFIMNFILTATNFIFPLITFPYVARVLLPAGNGKVSFVASATNYFIMIASLGIPTYGIRACASVRDDKDKLSKTVSEIFSINIIATSLVIISFVVCVFSVPKFSQEKSLFFINGINLVLNVIGMNWVFQALEQYDYITIRSILFKIVSIIFMFLLVHNPSDYIIYGAITVFAAAGSYVLNFYRLRKLVVLGFKDLHLKKHMKPILTLFSQSLAVSVYTNLDTVMLGIMKNDIEVGYYNAAVKIKHILLSLVTSLGNVLLPRMSYYYKKKMIDVFKRTMVKALNFTVFLSLPLVTFFILFSKEGLLIFAGKEYLDAVLAMQIITISVVPNGLTGVLGVQVLTPMEKERFVLYSVIIGAISDLILNLLLIPFYGAWGASLATTIAEFLVLIVQIGFLKNVLFEQLKKLRFHIYVIVTIISTLLAILVKMVFVSNVFISLSVYGLVFFGSYGLLLIVFREPIIISTMNSIILKLKGNKGENKDV